MNVPEQVRDGLTQVLDQAVNVRNRIPKRWKFCSEQSEDAVTWTVVRGLQQLGLLELLLPEDLRAGADSDPAILLWGVPAGGASATSLTRALESVSSALGEGARSRTEPDVVIASRDLLVIVEAKLGSANDRKPAEYSGWTLYTDSPAFAAGAKTVARTGLYELVRNWRVGWEIAGTKAFVLVNLVRLSAETEAERLRSILSLSDRRAFITRRWSDVIPEGVEWLDEFGRSRGLMA